MKSDLNQKQRTWRLPVCLPEWILIGLIVLVWFEITWLSWARYNGYNASVFDLGIMSQSIWSATQGHPLLFTAPGIPLSRLARHVEVFYFVLAPLYALLPTPKTLLAFQAALYAVAAWPIYALAFRRLGSHLAAMVCAVLYLFYPVAQTAVLFDLHGDTLAMPLLILALEALERKAWTSYGLWIVLALSCKFYVAVPVTALGSILWLGGQRRVGLITALVGAAWGAVAFFVIRPWFTPAEASHLYATSSGYVQHYFEWNSLYGHSFGIRLLNALIVYMPALWLGWRVPKWLLLASVTAIPTLLSNGPGPSFDYRAHHYALAVPFLTLAIVYGAEQVRKKQALILHLGATLLILFMLNSLFVDSPLNIRFYNPQPGSPTGMSSLQYGVTQRDTFKDYWLTRYIPQQAAIAADALLSVHLVNRPILYQTRPPRPNEVVRSLPELLPELDGVVIDGLMDFAVGSGDTTTTGGVLYERETARLLLQSKEFGLARADDGLLWFARNTDGLAQHIEIIPITQRPLLLTDFDDKIGLTEVTLKPLGNNRFRLTCSWVALTNLRDHPPFIAISQLRGVAHSRVLHLPTWALLPTTDWPTDALIREEIEFVFDQGLMGSYELVLSWHRATHLFAAETDWRSRVGDEFVIGTLNIQP